MHKINVEIWLTNFHKSSKDYFCINCNDLHKYLTQQLCQSLPGFHAFTGSDYTCSFYRKGKVKPFAILKKHPKYQKLFSDLNNPTCVENDEMMKILQEFTNTMYGLKNCTSVNNARFILFEKFFSSDSEGELFMKNVKQFDSNIIPPCWKSLKEKILRTTYVTNMWQNATDPVCTKYKLQDCGWLVNSNEVEPLWFEGDPTPLNIEDIIFPEDREYTIEEEFSELHAVETEDYNSD